MSRLATRFAQLKSQQRKALVSYVMAGDPHPEVTVPFITSNGRGWGRCD